MQVRGIVARPIEQAGRAAWTRAWFGRDFREEIVTALNEMIRSCMLMSSFPSVYNMI